MKIGVYCRVSGSSQKRILHQKIKDYQVLNSVNTTTMNIKFLLMQKVELSSKEKNLPNYSMNVEKVNSMVFGFMIMIDQVEMLM